jgi:RNA polymerase sigma-70 factor (ECF subfamily)
MSDDWELLELARKGEVYAWNTLISLHRKRLLKMLCILTGSLDNAEDIVQETFLRLFQNRREFYKGSFSAFIAKIAYNLALKSLARKVSKVEFADLVIADPSLPTLDCLLQEERNLHLWEVVSNLETEYREIISLRFFVGLSYSEIAEILKLPLGTVKSRLFYAVQKCRQGMFAKGYKNGSY